MTQDPETRTSSGVDDVSLRREGPVGVSLNKSRSHPCRGDRMYRDSYGAAWGLLRFIGYIQTIKNLLFKFINNSVYLKRGNDKYLDLRDSV